MQEKNVIRWLQDKGYLWNFQDRGPFVFAAKSATLEASTGTGWVG